MQDLFFEADTMMQAMLDAIAKGEKTPENWMDDPGFALTQANWEERAGTCGAASWSRMQARA